MVMGKIPIGHLIIYGDIRRKINGSKIVHIDLIKQIIKWRNRIPEQYQFIVVKELLDYGLLKRISRDNYEILGCRNKSPIDSLGEPFW